jgi:hypothetical protein
MTASRYPEARWLGNGGSGGSYTGGPWKVVLHTTETAGLPDYQGGRTSPHLTYDPKTRVWVQHSDLLVACRALRNDAGGAQTNRDQALQVEIICYSNGPLAAKEDYRLWVGDLPQTAYEDLAAFLVWTADEFGVKLRWPERQATSYAQANAPGFKLTEAEWDAFDGVCGHQHVPEGNTHWDPGALDWGRLFNETSKLTEAPMEPLKPYEEEAIARLIEAGVFTTYSVDNNPEGELDNPVPLRTLAVFLDRLLRVAGTGAQGPAGPPGPAGADGEDAEVVITVNGERVF